MAEVANSEQGNQMSETEIRTGAIPALKDFVRQQESTIGTNPEQRVSWLSSLQPQDFSRFLIDLNSKARIVSENHKFDGDGVQAGTVGGSVPPEQQDKEPILHYALAEIQKKAKQMLSTGASNQEVLDKAAVVLPTIVNKLHLFGDGNGRTSRILRMMIRDGAANADAGIDAIVSKDEFSNYDATPAVPIDRAIVAKLKEQSGIEDIQIEDDLDDDFEDDKIEFIKSLPNMNLRIANSLGDVGNFNIVAKDFAKKNNIGTVDEDGQTNVSLKGLFIELSNNPEKQSEFFDAYREIRKEKVRLWTDSLTGKLDLPISTKRNWLPSINIAREAKNQPPLIDEDLNTALKLQTAYLESQSPVRAQ